MAANLRGGRYAQSSAWMGIVERTTRGKGTCGRHRHSDHCPVRSAGLFREGFHTSHGGQSQPTGQPPPFRDPLGSLPGPGDEHVSGDPVDLGDHDDDVEGTVEEGTEAGAPQRGEDLGPGQGRGWRGGAGKKGPDTDHHFSGIGVGEPPPLLLWDLAGDR